MCFLSSLEVIILIAIIPVARLLKIITSPLVNILFHYSIYLFYFKVYFFLYPEKKTPDRDHPDISYCAQILIPALSVFVFVGIPALIDLYVNHLPI